MVDWYPTLLKLTGASLEQPLPIDGHDLWPAVVDGAASPHEEIVLNCAPQHGAIRMGDWKLVLNGQNNTGDGEMSLSKALPVETIELFDLGSDPGEKHNLADERPEIVSKLRARYEQLAKEAAPYKARPKRAGFKNPKVWGEAVVQ
jgi:arylsulfatase A-like enzyme